MPKSFEKQWTNTIHCQIPNANPILSICGPAGVGKTTVIKNLSGSYPVFIETTKGNPHLNALLEGRLNFNAAANQRWFLDRVGRHISKANPNLPLVLDQDPAAIVLAYAKMFLEDRKMEVTQYEALLKKLSKIEEALQRWTSPRILLFLDAPPDVLYHRVLRRSGKAKTPPLDWFERVRNQFVHLFPCFPNAFTISTEKNSAEQITKRARSLIERKIKESQA